MTQDGFVSACSLAERKLYAAALSVTANTEDAKDAVAEAIAYAWEHLKDLRDESKFDAWILRITYSQAKMIRRKNREYDSIDELSEMFSYDADTSELEFFDVLSSAKLDNDEREILTLYFLFGYTMPEIAEKIGRKPNYVKTKYYRALRKLADMKGLA